MLVTLLPSITTVNVDTGQSAALGLDFHITGNFLGLKSDIADGSLRKYEFRTFNNIVGEYYVAPRFLEKVTMHFAKNYLKAVGSIDDKVKVSNGRAQGCPARE